MLISSTRLVLSARVRTATPFHLAASWNVILPEHPRGESDIARIDDPQDKLERTATRDVCLTPRYPIIAINDAEAKVRMILGGI
jgi:hypothetical protein